MRGAAASSLIGSIVAIERLFSSRRTGIAVSYLNSEARRFEAIASYSVWPTGSFFALFAMMAWRALGHLNPGARRFNNAALRRLCLHVVAEVGEAIGEPQRGRAGVG